jgi:hypothetical protein
MHTLSLNRRQLLVLAGLTTLTARGVQGVSVAQRSPFATPETKAAGSALDGSLGRLLSMLPLTTIDSLPNGLAWTYVDLATQFSALSIQYSLEGTDAEQPIGNATLALAGSSPLLSYALDEELIAAIGFHPLGLDQILYAGGPGEQVQVFAAPFNPDVLASAWTASGYEPVETVNGVTIWTIGPDGEFDFQHPVQGRLVDTMNNLAIVDSAIIATPTLTALEAVLGYQEAGGESLLDDPATGSLVGTLPGTIAAALALHPNALTIDQTRVATEDLQQEELDSIRAEYGPMPSVLGAISAVEAGAFPIESDWSETGTREETVRPDAGTAFISLNTESPADADQALAVVEQRWTRLHSLLSHLTYDEILNLVSGSTSGSVVELEFRQMRSPQNWAQMPLSLDLLPFVPDHEA